jgi:hypothetical protein
VASLLLKLKKLHQPRLPLLHQLILLPRRMSEDLEERERLKRVIDPLVPIMESEDLLVRVEPPELTEVIDHQESPESQESLEMAKDNSRDVPELEEERRLKREVLERVTGVLKLTRKPLLKVKLPRRP